jgi:hypothetical protein
MQHRFNIIGNIITYYLFVIAINVCKPDPCKNGGSCWPKGGTDYACACVDGYTGTHCETG